MSLTSWFLVSGGGTRHRLPREMIFVGRDDCELMLQSRSVDKQHAVINYETTTDEHKVKDLGSLNGTFVNDVRIQEQMYVTLKIDDKLRFGYDTNLFTVVRAELHVPEEALKVRQRIEHPVKSKHEKFSSQLQLSQKKVPERETSRKVEVRQSEAAAPTSEVPNASKPPEAGKGEDKTTGDAVHRGTPLYGQPAWWGDGEMDQQHPGRQDARRQEKAEIDGKEPKKIAEAPKHGTVGQDPSYFEIPTKGEKAKAAGDGPSRDAEPDAGAEPAHGHASFTIEFDPGALGKVTVKDHVVKVAPETRPRPKRGVGEELSPLQTAMVAAEVKVADWLAQNELPLALKEAVADEDGESVKSDVPVHLRSLKGSKHEDGTQSDSENALGEQRRAAVHEERARGLWGGSGMKIREGRANVPEGLFVEEDSPARRQRFPASRVATFEGEVGGRRRSSAPYQHAARDEGYHHGDDHSDRVTYTIEIENGDHEEEEARRMIDRVFGVEEQHSASVSRLGGDDLPRDRLTYQRSGPGDRGKPGRMETEVLSEELVVGGPRWVSQWATLAASHIRTDPEGSGGETHTFVTEDRAEVSESSHSASLASSGYTERKRRTLPQLPCDDFALGRRAPGSGLRTDMGEKQDTELQEKENHKARGKGRAIQGSQGESPKRCSPAKSLDSGGGKGGHVGVMAKPPPRPLSSSEKRLEEARRRKREEEKAKENSGKPLLRQESFTVERPSSNVPIELIPRIDRHTEYRIQALDSTTLQKDSEAVAAFLETTVSDQGDPPSQSLEGSMSPESDVDTTSTVSQADGGRKVVQKRQTFVSQQKERAAAGSSGKGPSAARETHDKRVRTRAPAPQKPSQPWTSLDLTDDDVNSNSLLSDSQPTSIRASKGSRAQPVTVAASTKSSRAKVAQAAASSATTASKNTAVPRTSGPRPTRASLLRRARMGDSSDTEPADFDRMSVASEASTASSASRTGMVRRGMSRIEALAQPRRPRVGSPSAQSDSEAVTRSRGAGARSVAGDYAVRQGLRGSSVTSGVGPRARANSASKLSDKSKGTTPYGQVTPASNTRWRRVPVEYASTSEDEYGSNRHTSRHPGHTRPFPSTRVAQLGGSAPVTPSPGGPGSLRQNSREQDEYMKDWTAHSEEIARISQDLAKDLAMLAREIHDVAGEIDSVSPAASDPAVLLEEHVLDDSRSMEHSSTLESNGRQVELRSRGSTEQGSRSIRRQTWNRDDVVLDSLIFASVTQLSARIRQSVDKTANKIRILFKDKERRWDEVETKLQAEHDSLLLKSSNKEMSTILHDLKGVERQLLAIDIMLDPDGTLDALSDLGLTSPLVSEQGVGPGALQGAAGLLRASPGLSHANGASAEPRAALEAAERDPGLHADLGSASGEGQRAGPRN